MTRTEATNMIKNDIHLHHDYLSGEYRKALKMAISALEQPEIITCTECKYYDTDTEQCNDDKGLRFIDFSNPERMWCSWAERRDG